MNTRIKIAFVIPTLNRDEGGGILEFLYLLMKYLNQDVYQIEIFVFYSSEKDCEPFRSDRIVIHVAAEKKEANTYLSLVRWLSDKFRISTPQIVHTNIYWADTIGRQVAFKCKIPIIVMTEHNTNLNESAEQRKIKKDYRLTPI